VICNPAPVVKVPPSWYTALPEPVKLIFAVPVDPKSASPPFK